MKVFLGGTCNGSAWRAWLIKMLEINFLFSDEDLQLDQYQVKAFNMVGRMVKANGGKWFCNLEDVARYLNRGCND